MAITTSLGHKAAAAALVALTFGAGLTLNAGEAEARYGRKGLIAAGVIGALATGALIASSHRGYAAPGYDVEPSYGHAPAAPVYYHQPAPVYEAEPQPVYYGHPTYYGGHQGYDDGRYHRRQPRYSGYSETGFAYRGPRCTLKRQTFFDGYGYRTQKVQVCR